MSNQLRFWVVAFVAWSALAACVSWKGTEGEQIALKGTKELLVVYTGFVQPAMITYGKLPTCGPTAPKPLCKDAGAWAKIQAAAALADAAIQEARPFIADGRADAIQVGTAVSRITDAVAAFNGKGE